MLLPRTCMCGIIVVNNVSSANVRVPVTSWLAAPGGIAKRAFRMLPPADIFFGGFFA